MPAWLRDPGDVRDGRDGGQRHPALIARGTSRHLVAAVLLLVGCAAERPTLEELHQAGLRHLQLGDLATAEARAEAGLRRAGERSDAPWTWRFQVLRAEILGARGRNADVLSLLDQPMRRGAPDAADVRALVAMSRARCVSPDAVDSFQRAQSDLETGEKLAVSLASVELHAEVTLGRGVCATYAGDTAGAEGRFREALGVARQEALPLVEAKAATALGWLRARAGHYDDAAEWLQRSLAVSTRIGAELNSVRTLQNLGWCFYKLGEYDRALGFLARGQALAAERGFGDELHRILLTMGNTHYNAGDRGRAADTYQRAVAVARELGNRAQTAILLRNLSLVAVEQGRYEDAERYSDEAMQIKRELGDLASTQYSLWANGVIRAQRGDLGRAEALFREVIASPHSETELVWDARAALGDVLIRMGRPAEAEAELRAAFALMEGALAQLRGREPQISFFARLREHHERYVSFLVDQQRAGEALEVADRDRARRLRELAPHGEAPAVARFLKTAEEQDAVLLFYWLARGRSFLWVATPKGLTLHELPDVAEIRGRVEAHQARVLRARDPLEEGAADAEWLYETLVRPAAIPPGSKVVIAPDGPLHRINFETLVVPAPRRRYWIEDVTVITAPSLALLSAGEDAPPAGGGLLVLGDPTEVDAAFPALPQAAREVREIAALFDRPTVFTGPQAEPAAYRAARPAEHSFIHFTAHAQASAEVPLDSAIVLSSRNDTYKLYAREIAEIPIRAELVTLSACRSAGSRTYAGEGLVGLAWAFLGSGARNVIAGLWDVADTSTPDLMVELYRGVRRGLPPAEALRAAKLVFLRSETSYRKPFYWAPFVIYKRGR